ncbi:MAG TPA: ZIP family metal transporter [Elusimicrobiota bacterium]|nr:ZIP family metal transporter [Elusimicrobiota bacterium]
MNQALLYSVIAVTVTLGGSAFPLFRKQLSKKALWRLLSFGSGVLLGITFLDLLPESFELNARAASITTLVSFFLFFAVEEYTVVHGCTEWMEEGKCHSHSWGLSAMVSIFVHSVSDGLIMAAAFLHSNTLGTLVSAALLLHKFSDGLTLASLSLAEGRSPRRTALLATLVSLATPAGLLLGMMASPWITPVLLAILLGFAAGSFIYVGAADILPRIHETRDRLCWILFMMGAGLIGALS